jgi:hypothetical protein
MQDHVKKNELGRVYPVGRGASGLIFSFTRDKEVRNKFEIESEEE